jgi:hypothetical protein
MVGKVAMFRSGLAVSALLLLGVQGRLAMAAVEQSAQLRPPAEVQGWTVVSAKGQVVTPETIFKYMDGAGELYLSYAFRTLHVWTYERDGESTITVEAFDMGTPQEAFGVLTHDSEGENVGIGRRSAYVMGFLQVWQGQWYFRILADAETSASRRAVLALGRAFAAQVPGEGKEPEILSRLPGKGLVAGSIHYFHTQICLNMLHFFAVENLLQLSRQTDVVMADYRFGKDSAKLLIIQYLKASEAAKARAAFLKGYLPELPASSDAIQTARLENEEWMGLRLKDRFLALAFQSRSRDVCRRLLEAAKLESGGKKQ